MQDNNLDSIYTLPVCAQAQEIVESVNNHQVTIITAETGAGKSTQVPQFLAEAGYRKIIITQPRILAARNLCLRVRQEYSWRKQVDCTNLVGYRTAHEQDDSPDNVILYCTDGLQLVRELTGSGTRDKQVLILDEIHEWNENMEVLLAWAKKRCTEDSHFKLVLMSATIESSVLASFFGDYTPITVPGRSYPVEFGYSNNLYHAVEEELATPGANILVFLPGKSEIEQAVKVIQTMGYKVPIIPLHSQLEAEDQQKAFAHHESGKIVLATNIAQTSITIDDIDIVIDSGLERRIEIRSAVEGLFISETSKADCMQRAGRAGRTKNGKYILAKLGQMPATPLSARADYGVPEIMRKHIDRLVLRLASAGLDIEQLEFFHSPSKTAISRAKSTLTSLGALKDGQLTDVGKAMERFPVESPYARMLVQAKALPPETLAKLATIIAIQEVGGIVKGGPRATGWQIFTRQKKSDLLAQYDVYLRLPELKDYELEPYGIVPKNVEKAREVAERLYELLRIKEPDIELTTPLESINELEEEQILKCIVAGQLHQLWTIGLDGYATHIITKQKRELSSNTIIRRTKLCVGTPFDLEIASGEGRSTLHLLNDLTAVDPFWLSELAPNDFGLRPGKFEYDPHLGALSTRIVLEHQGMSIDTNSHSALENNKSNRRLFVSLFARWVARQLEVEKKSLHISIARRLPNIPIKIIEERVSHCAYNSISFIDLPKKNRLQLIAMTKLKSWYPEDALGHSYGLEHKKQGKHFARHHNNQKHKDYRR
jgi:HrpA-like RNA helicase